MDSGFSEASRSSTLVVALVSMVDWTSSALAWASVTLASASWMKVLKTSWAG
jgi:hypothetical protein